MIKRTLYFGNPAYLGMKNAQLEVRLPQVEKNDTLPAPFKESLVSSIPIEDIGMVVIDHSQVTLTQGLISTLLENNAAIITCDNTHHPTGLLLPLDGNIVQNERFRHQLDASEPLKKQLWAQTIIQKIKGEIDWHNKSTTTMESDIQIKEVCIKLKVDRLGNIKPVFSNTQKATAIQ